MGEMVAIVGSRDWPEPDAVRDYVYSLSMDDTVISGGATGVDTWAELASMERGLAFLKYPPRYDLYGKSATFIRNKEIVVNADRVVAFHFNHSKGTAISVQLAHDLGKPVIVFSR
jgi:predicted Rossmann fold nucleotide-binding protein DprA/Smf involved in DNA uptake